MPSSNDLSTFSDKRLLAREERSHKSRYELFFMVTCHFFWGIFRLVFDLMKMGAIHPHIFVAAIGGLSYYVGELCKADLHLIKLRQEIRGRPGLVISKLTPRDYMEVVATGVSISLGICGAVEVLDLALGTRNRGARLFLDIPTSVVDLEAGAK